MLSEHEQLIVLKAIIGDPGIYLHEIKGLIQDTVGSTVSESTICRTLKYMGCTRQVIRYVATQQSAELRARFMAEVSIYGPFIFVWLDESGFDRRNCMDTVSEVFLQ